MNSKCLRTIASLLTAVSLTLTAPAGLLAHDADDYSTKTPIKHVVVIFQENISFDHYFATYPYAANPEGKGEPEFHGKDHTPRANNLRAGGLLDENPNSYQPFRLDRSEAVTCDQGHGYKQEQSAFDQGLMDKFPQFTGSGNSTAFPCYDRGLGSDIVMGYYDGNTVTAMWNYAQHYAMSDNSFSTMFGPSAPGAINLVSGTTTHATASKQSTNIAGDPASGIGTIIGDIRPGYDECVQTSPLGNTTTAKFLNSKNVGDLLNAKSITWGWFQGGFKRTGISTAAATSGYAICATSNIGLAGSDANTVNNSSGGDYIPHHEPFQFYLSTSNPHHNPPTRSLIGEDETGVNHQYDFTNGPCATASTRVCTAFNLNNDFWHALDDGNLPAVSYLKASAYQDGHAGYSDPLDEQVLLVQTINRLMQSKEWPEMAIIIAYDDSDGWYDHAMSPIVNQSSDSTDDTLAFNTVTMTANCGTTPTGGQEGRCGYGPRQPLLVISPWAKTNYVDHRVTDQSSILRFIEYNWDLGTIGGTPNTSDSSDVKAGTLNGMFDFSNHVDRDRPARLILDPVSGEIVSDGYGQQHDHNSW